MRLLAIFLFLAFPLMAVDYSSAIVIKKLGASHEMVLTSSDDLNVDFDLLSQNPLLASRDATAMLKNLVHNGTCKTSCEIFAALQEKERHNPFWLLTECTAETCGLTRPSDGGDGARSRFEKVFMEHMPKRLGDASSEEGIDIILFAPGGAFLEAKLIASLMAQGVKIRALHLVDKSFAKTLVLLQPNEGENLYHLGALNLKAMNSDARSDALAQMRVHVELMRLLQLRRFLAQHTVQRPRIFFYGDVDAFLEKPISAHLFLAIDYLEGDGFAIIAAVQDGSKIVKALPKNCYSAVLASTQQRTIFYALSKKTSELGAEPFSEEVIFVHQDPEVVLEQTAQKRKEDLHK